MDFAHHVINGSFDSMLLLLSAPDEITVSVGTVFHGFHKIARHALVEVVIQVLVVVLFPVCRVFVLDHTFLDILVIVERMSLQRVQYRLALLRRKEPVAIRLEKQTSDWRRDELIAQGRDLVFAQAHQIETAPQHGSARRKVRAHTQSRHRERRVRAGISRHRSLGFDLERNHSSVGRPRMVELDAHTAIPFSSTGRPSGNFVIAQTGHIDFASE